MHDDHQRIWKTSEYNIIIHTVSESFIKIYIEILMSLEGGKIESMIVIHFLGYFSKIEKDRF